MKKYYIIIDDKKQGPFAIDELKDKSISPDTLVWEESFEDWKRSDEIPDIISMIRSNSDDSTSKENVIQKTGQIVKNDTLIIIAGCLMAFSGLFWFIFTEVVDVYWEYKFVMASVNIITSFALLIIAFSIRSRTWKIILVILGILNIIFSLIQNWGNLF